MPDPRPKIRRVLAQNLKTLMAANADESQSALKRRSGVAQATIGRILGDHGENARVETIDRLARAYNLQAWQLLIAGLEPSNPPILRTASAQEKALYDRLRATVDDIAKLKP